MEKNLPSRRQAKNAHEPPPPPGAPREDEPMQVEAQAAKPAANPFAVKKDAKPRLSLAGRYRVREGYEVAYPNPEPPQDGSIPRHGVAKAGELVELTHDDAVSIIRLTKDQRDPKTNRPHGPAIESEATYTARVRAEEEHARFMAEVNGVDTLNALDS